MRKFFKILGNILLLISVTSFILVKCFDEEISNYARKDERYIETTKKMSVSSYPSGKNVNVEEIVLEMFDWEEPMASFEAKDIKWEVVGKLDKGVVIRAQVHEDDYIEIPVIENGDYIEITPARITHVYGERKISYLEFIQEKFIKY